MSVRPRQEVRAFAMEMEAQLQRNDHKGGWEREPVMALFARLIEEAGELGAALGSLHTTPAEIRKEAADVANFAMMIADVSTVGGLAP